MFQPKERIQKVTQQYINMLCDEIGPQSGEVSIKIKDGKVVEVAPLFVFRF